MKNFWLTLGAIGIILVLLLLEIFAWREVASWNHFVHEFLREPTSLAIFWTHFLKVILFFVLVYSASAVLDWDVNDKSFLKTWGWWLGIPLACVVFFSILIALFSENFFFLTLGRWANTSLWIGNICLIFAFIANRSNSLDSFFSNQFEGFYATLKRRRREVAELNNRKEEKEKAGYKVILRTPEEQKIHEAKLAVEGKREIIFNRCRILLDLSPEVCGKWGVREGIRIRTERGRMTVLGIGKDPLDPEEEEQIWGNSDNKGIVHFSRTGWEEIFLSPLFLVFKNPEEEKAYESQLTAEGKREMFMGKRLVILDTNDSICEKWGVKAGMKITHKADPRQVIVIGAGMWWTKWKCFS